MRPAPTVNSKQIKQKSEMKYVGRIHILVAG